jgi:hypothetical protein
MEKRRVKREKLTLLMKGVIPTQISKNIRVL